MPKKITDSEMIGRVFGRLTILERDGDKDRWSCECSCGSGLTLSKSGKLLRSGETKSCGCLQRENAKQQAVNNTGVAVTHGMTKTKEYVAWKNMKARCDDIKHKAYPNYGGRGIGYTTDWETFEGFYLDMGDCPDSLTLDRLDVNLGYTKGNCEWADNFQQGINRRKATTETTCLYKGVSFNAKEGKYKAGLRYLGIMHHIGYDTDPLVLAIKYDELLIKLSGSDKGTNKHLGLY